MAKGYSETIEGIRSGDHGGPFMPSSVCLYRKYASQQATGSHVTVVLGKIFCSEKGLRDMCFLVADVIKTNQPLMNEWILVNTAYDDGSQRISSLCVREYVEMD